MSRLSLSSLRAPEAPTSRLALLIGQSFALGLTLALLVVAANALFLPEFGSGSLPYVYITVAVLGSLLFYGYAELERRWTLPALSITTLAILALFYLLSWLVLTLTGSRWVPFALMTSFSLVIQMGFVILGGQAGRLFDVRQLKSLFPRIVLGFAVGFLVGGFLAAPLANLLGDTENLVLAAVVSTLLFLVFLLIVDRRYHGALVQSGAPGRRQASQPMWQLLAKRFVLFIILYQMLAIMGSQLLDYMVLDQAAARFADSEALTQFFGNFVVGINASDVLFLALFAGLLLSRFGLSFGLAVNPAVDALILLAELLVAVLLGVNSALFFGLIVAARIIDITLTDGARRGAINTAYQALPAHQRVTVQTGVEGIAAPLALGLTGIVLLVFNAIGGITITHVVVLTLIITLLWIASANRMYRHYADSLRQTLRRRALDSAELTLDDSTSLAVVDRFLHSDDLAQVRLALDALEHAESEALERHLIILLEHAQPALRAEALVRIERLGIEAATPAVQWLASNEPDPAARGAAVRALCALLEADAVEVASTCLQDPAPAIRLGAAAGLLRYGGIVGVLEAGAWLTGLQQSADPADRRLVAQILGQIEVHNYYQPLLDLLVDSDRQVRNTALAAAAQVGHGRLLPLIVDNLSDARTRSAATAALVAYGPAVLPYAERALSSPESEPPSLAGRLARICGQIGLPQAMDLLKEHLGHKDGEVRYQVLAALRAAGYRAAAQDAPNISARLHQEVEEGAHLLAAIEDIGQDEKIAALRRALDDELSRVRQRVFLLLSFLYDPRALARAGDQLSSSSAASRAIALEVLDVTLSREHKGLVMPLVTPDYSAGKRLESLGKLFDLPRLSRTQRLCRFAEVQESGPSSWQRVAALYAAGQLGLTACLPAVEAAVASAPVEDFPLRETAAWSLHALAPERFGQWAARLSPDEDSRLLELARSLAGRDGERLSGQDSSDSDRK
ncbi:MAG: HEAT repeat domain-containing protein [Chloroflexota bacterium]|jgi:HEAT repeat protein